MLIFMRLHDRPSFFLTLQLTFPPLLMGQRHQLHDNRGSEWLKSLLFKFGASCYGVVISLASSRLTARSSNHIYVCALEIGLD
jgi:hypothetical protein